MESKTDELKVALALTKGVKAGLVRAMEEAALSLEEFFSLSDSALSEALNLAPGKFIYRYDREEALFKARDEVAFCSRHHISPLFLFDSGYPRRLAECPDAPVVLYCLGNADLNPEKAVSIVGTRGPTAYGMDFCRRLVEDVAPFFDGMAVVSGLAYGIDAAAHEAAIGVGTPTWAVLAHGLDTIYPAQHRQLARMILDRGGALLSEYPRGERPYRQRFLERNRIVAGVSDAVVVVESDVKGGAMSTANLAFGYGRDVMALPGRAGDRLSSGCNLLIRRQKAQLITCAADFLEQMDWRPMGIKVDGRQRELFPELEGDSRSIYELMRSSDTDLTADAISATLRMPIAKTLSALGELEFDGIIEKLPGNRYRITL